jgi:hypothetical protein
MAMRIDEFYGMAAGPDSGSGLGKDTMVAPPREARFQARLSVVST